MSTATMNDPFTPTVPTPGQATELINAGGYVGALVGLFDVGTHAEEYEGESKGSVRKIYFIWELEEENSKGERHLVGVEFTNSLGKKASLRQMIERTQGVELTQGETFPFRTLLGTSFDITVKNVKNGQYTNHRVEKAGIGPLHRRDKPIEAQFQRPHVMVSVNQGAEALKAMDLSWVPRIYGQTVLDRMLESAELAPVRAPAEGATPEKAADDLATVERILLSVADQPVKTPSRDAAIDEAVKIMKAARITADSLSPKARAVFDDVPF